MGGSRRGWVFTLGGVAGAFLLTACADQSSRPLNQRDTRTLQAYLMAVGAARGCDANTEAEVEAMHAWLDEKLENPADQATYKADSDQMVEMMAEAQRNGEVPADCERILAVLAKARLE